MTPSPPGDGTWLRPFENPLDVPTISLSDRVLGTPRLDLARAAVHRLLFERQPGQLRAADRSKIAKEYQLSEESLAALGEELFRDALLAFAMDGLISEEEQAYLIDLRRWLDIGEDTVMRCEALVLHERLRQYLAEVVASRKLSEVEKHHARSHGDRLRVPRDVQARLMREVVAAHISQLLKAPFEERRVSEELLDDVRELANSVEHRFSEEEESKLARYYLCWWLDSGRPIPPRDLPIGMKGDNEVGYFECPAEWSNLSRAVTESQAIPRGADAGLFYLTSDRLLFAGGRKSATITSKALAGIHVFRNGFAIKRATGRRHFLQVEPELVDVLAALFRRARPEVDHTTGTVPDAAPRDSSPSPMESEQTPIGVASGDAISQLRAMIGLSSVKHEITTLTNELRVQSLRRSQGLQTPPVTRHFVFSGNPGTGKTTVARIVGRVFAELGVLSKGHLIETDRAGMVSGYVGQTALKARDVINSALGGVLFIDEAYSLTSREGGADYGSEAIEVLLKMMEDHREDLTVIVAGYSAPMTRFLDANPGLRSRFSRFIEFPDYSVEELTDVFELLADEGGYELSDEAVARLRELLEQAHRGRSATFGNARFVRNMFERTLSLHANRVAGISRPTREDLQLIREVDLPVINP